MLDRYLSVCEIGSQRRIMRLDPTKGEALEISAYTMLSIFGLATIETIVKHKLAGKDRCRHVCAGSYAWERRRKRRSQNAVAKSSLASMLLCFYVLHVVKVVVSI